MLGKVIEILDRSMGMRRGTFTLLEGDELKIEASSSEMNAEEKSLGTYRLGEGITGLVAKTGKSEIVPDIRKDRRFLNRTRTRGEDDALSFVCAGGADEGIQDDLSPRALANYILHKMRHPEELEQKALAMRKAATPDAAARVADIVERKALD